MFNILMVCTANVCRSPMEEAILRDMIKKQNLESFISADSCGVWAMEDQEASKLTQQVAEENRLDLSHHQSKSITQILVDNSDLILCMSPSHKQEIVTYFPSSESKVFTLKEYKKKSIPPKETIDDPIGMTYNFYRRIFNEIDEEIKRIFPEIKELALEKTNTEE